MAFCYFSTEEAKMTLWVETFMKCARSTCQHWSSSRLAYSCGAYFATTTLWSRYGPNTPRSVFFLTWTQKYVLQNSITTLELLSLVWWGCLASTHAAFASGNFCHTDCPLFPSKYTKIFDAAKCPVLSARPSDLNDFGVCRPATTMSCSNGEAQKDRIITTPCSQKKLVGIIAAPKSVT